MQTSVTKETLCSSLAVMPTCSLEPGQALQTTKQILEYSASPDLLMKEGLGNLDFGNY